MALLKIRIFPDPVLRVRAEPVTVVDDEVRRILADMAETMYAGDGIGLAAPQVGISRRIVVMDTAMDDESHKPNLVYLINPRIVARSGDVTYSEGCLSFPDLHIDVKRSADVTVEFEDEKGEPRRIEASGITAVCLQHEMDHLDGVLFVDRIGLVRRRMALREFDRLQQQAAAGQG